jgi:hypothetical protein
MRPRSPRRAGKRLRARPARASVAEEQRSWTRLESVLGIARRDRQVPHRAKSATPQESLGVASGSRLVIGELSISARLPRRAMDAQHYKMVTQWNHSGIGFPGGGPLVL